MPKRRLGAKFKGHAAQDQPDQHHRHGQVKGGQDRAMRGGKGHQQKPDGQHEPSLVRIPERTDRGDHAIPLFAGCEGKEEADAKVKTV